DEGRKRERKKTDRLETSFNTPGSKGKALDIPEGSGTKLGEIENVEFQLKRVHGDELKPLHRVLYHRAGTTTEVKKNIRKFCGFTYAKNSADYDKRVQVIAKNTMAQLKLMCETLDIERGGTKENIVERIIDFLMSPHTSGKPLKQNK
ncbi:Protein DEK, partial [Lamellibrachia satsuma]